MRANIRRVTGLVVVLCGLVGYVQAQAPRAIATASVSSNGLFIQPLADARGWTLTVTGPGDFVFSTEGAQPPSFIVGDVGGPLADGTYRYELRAMAPSSAKGVAGASASEAGADGRAPGKSGPTPAEMPSLSGSFKVSGGAVIVPSLAPESGSQGLVSRPPGTRLDQVIPDDLIVQGSTCVGFDCVNGEAFGFDTIRLKENNTRIKFEDTSVAPFPTTDWQLTANESASGALNKFSIEDITAATVPFTIEGGALANSIYVDSTGRVGFRTATPVLDLHAATGNTPGLRFEQTSASGFTAQTWDMAGNEANFFVRDVTGGSRLPLRIRPGAPTSSVDIAASGFVGIGTAGPDAKLDIESADAAGVAFRLTKTSGGTAIWDVKNNGATGRLTFSDDATGVRVPFKFAPGAIDNLLRVGVVAANTVDTAGNLIVNGTFSNPSSRDVKDLLAPADGTSVLTKLSDLSLFTWAYKNDSVRHFGPVAEDFFARWGLGLDEKHISPNDMAGVALAASQELSVLLREKDAEIQALKDRLARLESLLGVSVEKKTETIKK
jgi:hypothetical protein